jgi:hypothetical protein
MDLEIMADSSTPGNFVNEMYDNNNRNHYFGA